MTDERIKHEIEHGKHLKDAWAGTFWYWETPAGKIRFARRVQMLSSHITGEMAVLEIGCGLGYFTAEMVSAKAKITAIDISPDLLDVAKEKIKADNVTFKVDNAYALSFKDRAFDTVVGSSILHHLDVEKALKEFRRVLKDGGTIYFTEPNMLNPQIFLERKTALFKKLSGTSPDESAFIRRLLSKTLERHGFCDIEIVPFDFLHPLTPRFLIPLVKTLGSFLESVPVVKEIAGSLYIRARKKNAA